MNKDEIVKTLIDYERQYGLVNAIYRVYGKNIQVNVGFSNSVCDFGIDELMLSVRSYNALRRAGINTVGDLIECLNSAGLSSIRNLGKKSICEIQTKMLVFGFEQLSQNEKKEFFCRMVQNNMPITND